MAIYFQQAGSLHCSLESPTNRFLRFNVWQPARINTAFPGYVGERKTSQTATRAPTPIDERGWHPRFVANLYGSLGTRQLTKEQIEDRHWNSDCAARPSKHAHSGKQQELISRYLLLNFNAATGAFYIGLDLVGFFLRYGFFQFCRT